MPREEELCKYMRHVPKNGDSGIMKRIFTCAILLVALSEVAVSAAAATVRTKSDLRIWQTAMHPSEPIAWPWEKGADSATVTLSNRLTGVVSQYAVEKSGDELRGTCALPATAAGAEAFYAATLTLFAGAAEVARYTADIACVNGVAGRTFDVKDSTGGKWRRAKGAMLSTYDAAWLDETTNAVSAAIAANGGAGEALPGTSGYLVLKSEEPGDVRFDLGFDDDPDVWTALLRFCAPGFMLFLR